MGVVIVRSARVGSVLIARNGERPDDKYDWVVSDDLHPPHPVDAANADERHQENSEMFWQY